MPTVAISSARLRRLMRADLDDVQLEAVLDQLGCDLEGFTTVQRYASRHSDYILELLPGESLPLTDPHSGVTVERAEELWELAGEEQVVRMELLPVRPDLFDAGGLARAIRGYLGLELGLPHYAVTDTGPLSTGLSTAWRVEVDAAAAEVRPYIQCAVIRDIEVDAELLRAMMKLQEHLHWALARDRKFASIGTYDLAALQSPISYTLVDRDEFRFTPLFWAHRGDVSPAVMLAEHPKGVGYAHLLAGQQRIPALLAANGTVLSLPPIINAEQSRVTTATRDLFIDVTGTNQTVVNRALAIMVTSLLELDVHGRAHLERVEVAHPDGVEQTPALELQRVELHPQRAAKLIGVELTREQCRELLLKMRHGVEDAHANDHGGADTEPPLLVTVAPYRNDIMHEVDLIEDVAIAYGYHHIEPRLVPSFTAGRSLPLTELSRRAAAALSGLGFIESQSLTLTSERDHYEKLRRAVTDQRVTLANPISADQTMLREHLYSGLLELLGHNTDQSLPQRVFEVGDVVRFTTDESLHGSAALLERPAELSSAQPQTDERLRESAAPTELRLIAGAICAPRTGYAEGRSTLDALLAELSHADGLTYAAADNPTALPGRAAVVTGADGAPLAEVFEVHPEVLDAWGVKSPVVLFSALLGQVEYGNVAL